MHQITTRAPTEEEWKQIRQRARRDFGGLMGVCIISVCIVLLSLWSHEWFVPLMGKEAASVGRILAIALGVSTFLWLLKFHFRHERKRLRGAKQDIELGIVEELYVKDAPVIGLTPDLPEACALCFDLGDNRLLYLCGEWFYVPCTYGIDLKELSKSGPVTDRLNYLPDPFGFPCTEFVLNRLPSSGTVLSVRVLGKYQPLEYVLDLVEPEHDFSESEIFEGQLADVALILAREHDKRVTTMIDDKRTEL